MARHRQQYEKKKTDAYLFFSNRECNVRDVGHGRVRRVTIISLQSLANAAVRHYGYDVASAKEKSVMVSLKKASIAVAFGLGLMACGGAAVAPSAAPAVGSSVAIGTDANARKDCRENHSSPGAAIFTPNDPESAPATPASKQALAFCAPKHNVR